MRKNTFKSVDIESYLISWGLLSSSIDSSQDRKVKLSSFRSVLRQRFQLIFLWLLSIKLLICCLLPDESAIIFILGDAGGFMGGPRIQMRTIFLLWTLPGAFIASAFFINSKNKSMNKWLKIYEICEKRVDLSEHNFTEEMAVKFGRRVNLTLTLFKFLLYGSLIASPSCFLWTYFNRWPQSYRYSIWAFIWSFIDILWVFYNQNTMQSSLILFHQICYYITLRFKKFHKDIEQELRRNDPNKLLSLLEEHNEISELVFDCNKFWQTFIATTYGFEGPLLTIEGALLTVHVSIFPTNVLPMIRSGYIFMTFTIVAYVTVMTLSASKVEYWSRMSYNTLNSISQNKMPLLLSSKLLNTTQRIGGHKNGFTFYDICTISYKRYFDAILSASTYFLLIMDLNLS